MFKVTGAGTHLAVVPGYYCKSGMATLMVWHSEPKGGIENLPQRPKRYDILKGEPFPNPKEDIRWFNKVGTYYNGEYDAYVTEYQGGLWGPSSEYLRTKAEQYNLQFTVNYKLTFKYWRAKYTDGPWGVEKHWVRKDDVVKYVAPGERARLCWGIHAPRLRHAYVGWSKVNRWGHNRRFKLVGIEPDLRNENHLHSASTTVYTTIKKYGTTEIANYRGWRGYWYKFYHKVKILGYDANGRHVRSRSYDITEKLRGANGGNGGNGGNERDGDHDLDTMMEVELVNAETGRPVSPIMCGGRWPDQGESTPVFSWKFIGKGASNNGQSIGVAFSDAYKPLTLWRVNPLTYGRNPFKIGVRKASNIPPKLQTVPTTSVSSTRLGEWDSTQWGSTTIKLSEDTSR